MLSILTTEANIIAAAGGTGAPEGIAFGSDGFLYVNDFSTDSVLKVHPVTGAVSVLTTEATLDALIGGADNVTLGAGIIGAPGGVLYVVSNDDDDDNDPNAIFAIDLATGTPSVVTSRDFGDSFKRLRYMTRAANGDLIIADETGDNTDSIFRLISPGGATSTLISDATLDGFTGSEADLEGGIAFDSLGNLFVTEQNEGNILQFTPTLMGSVFVTSAAIAAITGDDPFLAGGMAFAPAAVPQQPVPEPSTAVLLCTGLISMAVAVYQRRQRA